MRLSYLLAFACLPLPTLAQAQEHDHGHHDHAPPAEAPATPAPPATAEPQQDHSTMDHSSMDHGTMDHGAHGNSTGALGAYPMTRDGSGTAWQPDSSPHSGIMFDLGRGWNGMAHGFGALVHDRQGGPRGDRKTFFSSMLMGMAQRQLGPGTLTLKAMGSLDPLMGRAGYPLLLATGETADGETELVDRQHPHDAIAELSLTYSHPLRGGLSGFVYLGLPGEPALGPATYLHRFSGMASPEAPISHHFLDSTHVTFGVATVGLASERFKLEGSVFTGREPDERRWDIEEPRFDSWSLRATFNPTANWSMQLSHGFLRSPEGLHPDEDVRRTTASVTYNRPLGEDRNWQTTLAVGRNKLSGGHHDLPTLDALLLESALDLGSTTLFGRYELAEKDELFGDEHDGDPLAGRVFDVAKLSVGGHYTVPLGNVSLDLGGLISRYGLPKAIEPRYGESPTSVMLFTRLRLGR